jgi:hypothetical protein
VVDIFQAKTKRALAHSGFWPFEISFAFDLQGVRVDGEGGIAVRSVQVILFLIF